MRRRVSLLELGAPLHPVRALFDRTSLSHRVLTHAADAAYDFARHDWPTNGERRWRRQPQRRSSARRTARQGFLGQHRRPLHDRRRRGRPSASRSSSTRCRRARSPRRCTGTRARTSTATCSRGGWARCWATTSSTPAPAAWSSSRATSGTRSGTRATSRAGSSRSSRRPASSHFFARARRLGGALEADPEALAALDDALRPRDAAGTAPDAARALRAADRRAALAAARPSQPARDGQSVHARPSPCASCAEAGDGIRTHDLPLTRRLLWPAELLRRERQCRRQWSRLAPRRPINGL